MVVLLGSCMLVYAKVCNVHIYIGAETWCVSMNQFVTISSLLQRLYAYHTKSKSAQSCRKCPYAHDIDAQNRCRKVTPHEGLFPRWTPTCPPNVVGPLVCSNFTWAPFGCTPKFQSVPSFCLWGCCSGPGKGTGILASGLKLQRKKFNDLKISLQPPCAFTHVCTCMHRHKHNCPWNNNGNPACITSVTILAISYCAEESWTVAKTTTAARRMVVFIIPLNSRCCSEQVVVCDFFSFFAQSIRVRSVKKGCFFYSRLQIAACAQTWVSINTRTRIRKCPSDNHDVHIT